MTAADIVDLIQSVKLNIELNENINGMITIIAGRLLRLFC
jgi:hypothetical protein